MSWIFSDQFGDDTFQENNNISFYLFVYQRKDSTPSQSWLGLYQYVLPQADTTNKTPLLSKMMRQEMPVCQRFLLLLCFSTSSIMGPELSFTLPGWKDRFNSTIHKLR